MEARRPVTLVEDRLPLEEKASEGTPGTLHLGGIVQVCKHTYSREFAALMPDGHFDTPRFLQTRAGECTVVCASANSSGHEIV
ncbi:hypothetical protein GCM10022276_28730 [Sphingomonas limnosediminicola]|uniref:Uncharacterized protein n=1 Tax=Sphingomonas limnosediminicola TaxID=940133 RepID=A0ABP7LYY1_9SPHN